MKDQTKVIVIKSPNTTLGILQVLNGVLGLTGRELQVVAAANTLGVQYAFTTQGKRKLVKAAELTSIEALNNIIFTLKNKNILSVVDDVYELHPLARVDVDINQIVIKFKSED